MEPIATVPAYDMVFVRGGKYVMGQEHPDWEDLASHHKQELREEFVADFLIGRYLVTFDLFDSYCDAQLLPKPADIEGNRGAYPVINITWLEATRFCNWMSRKEGIPEAFNDEGKLVVTEKDGKKTLHDCGKKIDASVLAKIPGYRLPLDSEWEYAAKGGDQSRNYKFIGGDRVDDVAWYKDNTRYSTKPIGLKMPNELQIFDMAGNVYEYCLDGKLQNRTVRGGGWSSQMQSMRSAYKNGCRLDESHSYVGFRLAKSKTEN